MGYDAYSYAVFGKQVSKRDLTVVTKVRGCLHNTDTTQKFCSECGNPVWTQEEAFIADEGYGKKIGFFKSSADTDDGVLGFKLVSTQSSDYDYHPIPVPTPGMAVEILDFFKKHGIACYEDELKSYLYTYHSY